jgi:hypothetical protein
VDGVTVRGLSTGAIAPHNKEDVMKRHSGNPPQADHREALNRLVQRLEHARQLAKEQGDQTLVGILDSAYATAVNLLSLYPDQVEGKTSRAAMLIASAKAIELIVEEIIGKLVENGLHSLF